MRIADEGMGSLDKSRDHLAEQLRLLKSAGADFLILETFFHLAEATRVRGLCQDGSHGGIGLPVAAAGIAYTRALARVRGMKSVNRSIHLNAELDFNWGVIKSGCAALRTERRLAAGFATKPKQTRSRPGTRQPQSRSQTGAPHPLF